MTAAPRDRSPEMQRATDKVLAHAPETLSEAQRRAIRGLGVEVVGHAEDAPGLLQFLNARCDQLITCRYGRH